MALPTPPTLPVSVASSALPLKSPVRSMILFPRIADGSLLCVLEGHTGSVYRVAFSFDDTLLASASRDGTVRLWGVGG